jgi:hypothetical protein
MTSSDVADSSRMFSLKWAKFTAPLGSKESYECMDMYSETRAAQCSMHWAASAWFPLSACLFAMLMSHVSLKKACLYRENLIHFVH